MAILNSKTVLIPVIVLSFAAGAGAVAVLNNSKDDNKTTSSTTSKPASPTSPGAIVKNPGDYTGKQVALEGIVVEVTDTKTYLLSDVNTKTPGAIKLDFSKSGVDPAKLVTESATTTAPTAPPTGSSKPVSAPGGSATSNSSGSKSSAKPVTVIGTVSTETTGQPVLIVKSVD